MEPQLFFRMFVLYFIMHKINKHFVLQILGNSLRVDHVADYKPPKEKNKNKGDLRNNSESYAPASRPR